MPHPLKFGLFGLHKGKSADPDVLARRAKLAEEAGFESLWIGDHIALPVPDPPEPDSAGLVPRLEALIALTFLAAATERVRLVAGVIVLPQRQPVLLAKQLASLDVLSAGRLSIGLGLGYVEAELNALGVELSERASRANEYLEAMLSLWGEPIPKLAGRFVSFKGVVQRPRPVQRPHPPIIIGGHSSAAFRRAIERGDGWYGWDLDVEETAQALADLREAGGRYQRDVGRQDLEITITPKQPLDRELAQRYADLGVHRLVVQQSDAIGSPSEEFIREVSDSVIGRV